MANGLANGFKDVLGGAPEPVKPMGPMGRPAPVMPISPVSPSGPAYRAMEPRPMQPMREPFKRMRPLGMLHDGTQYVPKTGSYVLEEGEKVIPKDKSMALDHLKDIMGGTEPPKAPKKLKHILHRRATNGGHVFEHHFDHPDHKMEEHAFEDHDSAVDHFIDHGTDENEGEAESQAEGYKEE